MSYDIRKALEKARDKKKKLYNVQENADKVCILANGLTRSFGSLASAAGNTPNVNCVGVFTELSMKELEGLFVEIALFGILAELHGATDLVGIQCMPNMVECVVQGLEQHRIRNYEQLPCVAKCGICCDCKRVRADLNIPESDWMSFGHRYETILQRASQCRGFLIKPAVYANIPGRCENSAEKNFVLCKYCVENPKTWIEVMSPDFYSQGFVGVKGRNFPRPPAPHVLVMVPPIEPPNLEAGKLPQD